MSHSRNIRMRSNSLSSSGIHQYRGSIYCGGFSLVEAMVAITIGAIIVAALSQIFSTSKATYRVQESMSRVQESGRFAHEFVTRDVRMAGYSGCLAKEANVTNTLANPTDYVADYKLGKHLTGHRYEGTGGSALADWSPDLPGTINSITYFAAGEVEPYTDVLVIRRAEENGVRITGVPSDTSADLKVSSNSGLAVDDIVLVSDCKNGAIFQITGPASSVDNGNLVHNTGASTPGNLTKEFGVLFGPGAEVYKLVTRAYYIGRRGNSASNPPSLFRKELVKSGFVTSELAEGVERLLVLYGIDSDADKTANQYKNAKDVTAAEWSQVVSARVLFLVQTTENADITNDTFTYNISDVDISPKTADKRRRHVFSSTIQLRNP